jgi:hypothetical protein
MRCKPGHEHEKDEEHLAQIHDAELVDRVRPIDRAVDGVAQHPGLEARQQRSEDRPLDSQRAPQRPARQEHQPAGREHDAHDDQVGRVERHAREGQKERRGQSHADDQPPQVAHGPRLEEAQPPQPRAEQDQQKDRQHLAECGEEEHGRECFLARR